MMNIRALVIFIFTFTTINAIISPCVENSNCQCVSINSDELKVFCNVNNKTKFIIDIVSGDNLQIFCKNWEGWKDFDFTSKLPGEIIDSVHFKHCGLSNEISLKDVVEKLGVEKTNTLIFQSFQNLQTILKREHLQGFSNVTKLIFTHNGLTNISNDLFLDFTELEWLDLSDNNIVLSNDTFDATPNLKRIKLLKNGIEMITVGTFNKLQNLEFLNLMENKLTEIEEGIFDKLISLKSLFLSMNNLQKLPLTIFHQLKKLETLDISFNNFSSLQSDLFKQNKELRQLLLNGNNNNMTTLPDYFLSNFTKLEEVILNENKFTVLPENLFWGSSSLKYIELNDNFLITLPKNIFKGLRNVEQLSIKQNRIKTLPDKIFEDMESLDKLDLSMNQMVSITSDLFEGLEYLTELNMERNQLKYIEETALVHLVHLNIAIFSHNQLKLNNTGGKLSSFYNNPFLMELHLSNNSIQNFFSDWSLSKYNLRLLNLTHNNISTVSATDFILPSDNVIIDLRYNNIKNIFLNHAESATTLYFERDVFIYVEHNPLLCDCNLYDLLRFRENKMSFFVYNYFKIIMGNLTCFQPDGTEGPKLEQLNSTTYKCLEDEYFNIERNCQFCCTCYVRPEDETRILDCSNNKMSEFFVDKKKVNFERDYDFILNLTGNLLTKMPSVQLLKPINVTSLLLSDNHISEITLDKLPESLIVLELHNNNISKLNLDVLNYLNSSFLKEFTLSGNPINCDCDTEDLLHFIHHKRFYYKDLGNVKCKNMDFPMFEMTTEQLCQIPIGINHPLSIIFISIIGSFFVAAFIAWFYKYKIKPGLNGRPEMNVEYSAVQTTEN